MPTGYGRARAAVRLERPRRMRPTEQCARRPGRGPGRVAGRSPSGNSTAPEKTWVGALPEFRRGTGSGLCGASETGAELDEVGREEWLPSAGTGASASPRKRGAPGRGPRVSLPGEVALRD